MNKIPMNESTKYYVDFKISEYTGRKDQDNKELSNSETTLKCVKFTRFNETAKASNNT